MNLHHVRRGAGDPLLLIQGMSGNHEHWGTRFLELLERDFDVIAYDHRGVGWSPEITGPFTIAELAEDADALLDRLGVDSAHVMGISMGGMVAQELALNHPERVRTLTLGCTYAGGPDGTLADAQVFAPMVEALRAGDREGAIRASWEANVSAAFAADDEAYAAFHATALRRPTALRVLMLQMRAIAAHDAHARLGEITAPTLIIHGSEDQMLVVGNGAAIARAMPMARFERYEGAGHMFWIEQPERTAELVRQHALAGAAA